MASPVLLVCQLFLEQGLVCVVDEVRLVSEVVATGAKRFVAAQMLDKDFALVAAPCCQNDILLPDIGCVIKPAQHDGPTLGAGEVRELIPDSLILDELLLV